MKPAFRYITTLVSLLCCVLSTVEAQQEHMTNYYTTIKTFDLSKLWHDSKLNIIEGEVTTIKFPEPLGYIGNNYQRFYIHYTSIVKDKDNPYRYNVEGKTKVNNNICSFRGTITIFKASITKNKQGEVICLVDLREDSTHAASGIIRGKLVTDWFLNKRGVISYDTNEFDADGFCNNQFEGTWTNYRTRKSKTCNWGDFRIPESKNLDIGAGDFDVSDKYKKYGWMSYSKSLYQRDPDHNKAVVEENRKWWK